jgi:hypothetical protein
MSCEDLIANELASAISGAPLEKIRHACEAIMLLGEKELKQAGISAEEVGDAIKMHELSIDLGNLYIHSLTDKYGVTTDLYASIPWSFPRRDAEKWMGKWAQDLDCHHWAIDREAELIKIENKFERMWATTQGQIPVPTARIFLSRFVSFAMPEAIGFMKKAITLVSPDSYQAALAIIRGDKRGKDSQA